MATFQSCAPFHTRLLTLLFVLVSMISASGCLYKRDRVYNTYKDREVGEEIPAANYEGRPASRFEPLEEWDYTESTLLKESRLASDEVFMPFEDNSYLPEVQAVADYALGAGDILEVIYQIRSSNDDVYKLEILDLLSITFPYTPQFNREVRVRTDGKVDLPIVGEVVFENKTTTQLVEELKEKFSGSLKNPVIEIRVLEANRAIEELKRAITTAPRGQSRLEPIRPDGFISLPLIGDVLAGGLTVPELSQAVVEAYQNFGIRDLDVTVVLLEIKSPVAYVSGEVAETGPIVLDRPMDVWRAIQEVGGFSDAADQTHVILARTTREGERRFVLNYKEWLLGASTNNNMMMLPTDIVYVPTAKDRYVYIYGEVKEPGRFLLDPESRMHVSQALAMGGEILSTAKRQQILVLRKSDNGEPIVIETDMLALTVPASYDDPDDYVPRDPVLEPGDIVYVPPSFIGDVDRFADAWFRRGIWTIIPFNVNLNFSGN